jgi:hypothetical protein
MCTKEESLSDLFSVKGMVSVCALASEINPKHNWHDITSAAKIFFFIPFTLNKISIF